LLAAQRFTYSFMPLAEQKFISLNFSSAVDKMNMILDRDKLEKIINNLLSNAFKFTPSGGKISVNILIESSSDPSIAIIKVTDTGAGIPREYQSKIFDRFFKIEDDSNRKSGWLRYWISACKRISRITQLEYFC